MPNPISLHGIISVQKALKLCTSTHTPNHLVWILFPINKLPPSSDSLLKTQAVYSSETLLPRPHVILTYTILCFFTTMKTWSEELWNINDKSVDGSCWENWMTSITLFYLLPTQHLMLQCFAQLLCYSFFYFPEWNKTGKRYNEITTSRPFWNAKYVDGFTVNTSVSNMKVSTNEWNKYNYIYHQTTNSDSYSCYSIHDALKFIGEHNMHRILISD